jgi:hypothetical protein
MAYSVKLKNQEGTEINYSNVEQVSIPLASGNGDATFMARYDVGKYVSTNIDYDGGKHACNGVDYLCRIFITGTTARNVPDSITVRIGSTEATANVAYVYTKLTDTQAVVKIHGACITGAIEIEAVAVTPSA